MESGTNVIPTAVDGTLSGTSRVSQHQKGKTNLDYFLPIMSDYTLIAKTVVCVFVYTLITSKQSTQLLHTVLTVCVAMFFDSDLAVNSSIWQ